MSERSLPFATRLWLSWACFFRVLFDGAFAARVEAAGAEPLAPKPLPPSRARSPHTRAEEDDDKDDDDKDDDDKDDDDGPPSSSPSPPPAKVEGKKTTSTTTTTTSTTTDEVGRGEADPGPALALLALLQREGRFVDFIQQDVADFSDEQIGAAARVVHEGCRKAIRSHVTIEPVHDKAEGDPVKVEAGYKPAEIKLTGNVKGSGPFRGTLRHKGWRATKIELPVPMAGHDAHVVAPAEVEL